MTDLDRITKRVNQHGDPNDPSTPIPLLSLEEFFLGNTIAGSICCNLDPCPNPEDVFDVLLQIRKRAEVSDVRIQVTAFDDPDWPFSDTAWIVTGEDEAAVRSWFPKRLAPNECWEGWIESQTYEEIPLAAGHKPIAVWWD